MKCGSTAPTWWLRPACLVAPAQLVEMASTTWLATFLEATAGPHTTGLLHARHDALHAALLMHMNQFHLFTACALGFTFCCCCFVLDSTAGVLSGSTPFTSQLAAASLLNAAVVHEARYSNAVFRRHIDDLSWHVQEYQDGDDNTSHQYWRPAGTLRRQDAIPH